MTIYAAIKSAIAYGDDIDKNGDATYRTIALSENNMILIYDGEIVVTVIQHNSKKAAIDYFNAHSAPETRNYPKKRLIKWLKERFSLA